MFAYKYRPPLDHWRNQRVFESQIYSARLKRMFVAGIEDTCPRNEP